MLDLHRAVATLAPRVTPVLDELVAVHADLPDLMVVGATCRDALHAGAGHDFPLRATDDLDIALAVSGWENFRELTARLTRAPGSASSIRFTIAGLPVDLVPFGPPVEEPDGIVTPASARDRMSVFGFQDVLASAHELTLPSGHPVRLPSVPGYAVLKLKAWVDRAPAGTYKDASDLASAMFWYQNAPDVVARLWDDEASRHLLDTYVAAVRDCLARHDPHPGPASTGTGTISGRLPVAPDDDDSGMRQA